MNLRFKHLGVAVQDVEKALPVYREILGYRLTSGPFEDPIQRVSVCFLAPAEEGPELELISPLTCRLAGAKDTQQRRRCVSSMLRGSELRRSYGGIIQQGLCDGGRPGAGGGVWRPSHRLAVYAHAPVAGIGRS